MSTENNKDEEEGSENGPLFLVNKSGFPIAHEQWTRMFAFSVKLNEERRNEIEKLQAKSDAKDVPIPIAPVNVPAGTPVYQRIDMIQNYMRKLQYNHTGTQFYDIKKYRPLNGLNEVAREMIRESLPIKCLEAVVLGIYLTNGIHNLERFTIGLKSEFEGTIHRHVVLGLCFGGSFGTIGMSRREDLMFKYMSFSSLSDLVYDFKRCYEKYCHKLKRVKLGNAITHDAHSYEGIPWKGIIIMFGKEKDVDIRNSIDKFSRKLKAHSYTTLPQHTLPVLSNKTKNPLKDSATKAVRRNDCAVKI